MTIFISRDYNPTTSGYVSQPFGGSFSTNNTGRFYVGFMYQLTLFLQKVLGYTVVGQTSWNMDNNNIKSLVVTAATNTTPITITTASAHGLSDGYVVNITGGTGNSAVNGTWKVTVLNSTQATLYGTFGNGTYTASTATMTTGFLYASGMVTDGYGAGLNFGAGSFFDVSIPITQRKVVVGDVGKILVLKSNSFPTKNTGLFKISARNTGNTTTIAAASNGATLPQATINVASTAGFPASGTIFVTTATNTSTVTYTGTTGTTFTGCSGGTGTMATGGEVANLNRYIIDYRSTETPPVEATNSIDWWLYETEVIAAGYLSKFYGGNWGVGGSTNTTPIVIQGDSNFPHTWITGQKVVVSGTGNVNANGTWTITQATDSTRFSLNGSVAGGAFGSGGTLSLFGYTGGPDTANSRIILQSPHSSAWQVRICAEPMGANLPCVSIAVGYGGNSAGDFPAGATSTHVVEFMDINSASNTSLANTVPGGGHVTLVSRMSMVGDGYGQYVAAFMRETGGNNGMLVFGISDNEPAPLPDNPSRIFCYGGAPTTDFGTIRLRMGAATNVGVTIGTNTPEFCALTSWANLDGTSATNPMLSANAGDSPFTSTTEILPIEVWRATTADVTLTTAIISPFSYNPGFMGTAPALRNGRTNFGDFSLTSDEVTSRAISAATNASPIQITAAANALTTGQTVTISGVLGNTAANGTWIVTVLNSTQFTLNNSVGNGTYTSGGTATGCARWLHLQNGIYLQWNGPSGLTP